ncbi:Putative serine/threonine-protein kinase VPS15 [Wickerhamiella sorbophila]|uniref:non-specific serine/threonine protein kinase n=1 Tax=Wickerhamiella sorbophila TaxID=45607 RepID=A0A2T0FNU9_9ASCO|nr:Putative serine/threonine-protein kinase VPS15 [Wickerhamiella sorbophila]PRT56658.1 Putative serine/threonine-protein kinase VPS15 [Wickerhamiella sorbophila]
MGSALSTVAPRPTVPIDAYIAELGDLTYTVDLGQGGRFLKSVRAAHRDSETVVKVLIKPPAGLDLAETKQRLTDLKQALKDNLNAISYSRIVETDRAGYLVRQYIKHNLYDRISNRPFLEPIEKKWLVLQLLICLKNVHARNFCHGDIKSENVLVTSWKWLYLVDWAPYKPVSLPENDSAQFLYFFDTSQRRSCYVAPERFGGAERLTPAMDIYSAGCVIAELFCDGKPLFTLADLFKYRRKEYMPSLDSIEDDNVRSLIYSMISLDPADRHSADHYLQEYRGTLFPEYFDYFYKLMEPFSGSAENESDLVVQAVYDAFPTILQSMDIAVEKQSHKELLEAKGYRVSLHECWVPKPAKSQQPAALIILSLICSVMKSTSTASKRLMSIDLIMGLSHALSSEALLDRCLPYIVSMLSSKDSVIQMTSLQALTHLLIMVDQLTPLNQQLFGEYLFPQLRAVLTSSDAKVRAVYAECLPCIVERAIALNSEDVASHAQIEDHIRVLVVEKDTLVRRAFLDNASSLCVAMGRTKANDIVLSHVLTYFNKKDSHLLASIFRFIARIGPLLGSASLENYAIPLIQINLTEWRDESVVAAALQALGNLAELGLIRLRILWEIIASAKKFFIHPSPGIRAQAFLLVSSAAKHLSSAQIYCLLVPMISPLMQTDVSDFKQYRSLVAAAKPPMARAVYNLCLTWASQARKDTFWRRDETTFSTEDKRWLERLRDVGFNNEDLWQIIVLKDYIRQVALPDYMGDEEQSLQEALRKVSLQTWSGDEKATPELEKYLIAHARDKGTTTDATEPGNSSPTPQSNAQPFSATLVTSIKAHRGCINCLAYPESNEVFVTGADDGIVKLWEVASLRKGSSRPSVTFDFGSQVKSLAFLTDTEFVVSTSDGMLHFMECLTPESESKKPGKTTFSLVRVLELPDHAIAIHYHRKVLYVLGADSHIYLIDLADNDHMTDLECPVEFGIPTCWVFDPQHQWVAVGSTHGVVSLWDLRFQLLVQSFGVGDLAPITSMVLHPSGTPTWVFIGGGFARSLISAWDVHTAECRELLVPLTAGELPLPPLESITDLANRLAIWTVSEDVVYTVLSTFPQSGKDQRIITAGSDRIIRDWNLSAPNLSSIISGFTYSRPLPAYSGRIGSDVKFLFERQSAQKKPEKQSRITAISKEEADIGRNHRGTITNIGVLHTQRAIIVSADEVGYVKVYV